MDLTEIIENLERLYQEKAILDARQEKLSKLMAKALQRTRTAKKVNFEDVSNQLMRRMTQNRAEINKFQRWQEELLTRDEKDQSVFTDGFIPLQATKKPPPVSEGNEASDPEAKNTSEFKEYEEANEETLTPFRPKVNFKYEIITFGTWRIALSVLVMELKKRKVRFVLDVRGNPNAGRETQYFRKAFGRSLKRANIKYEYVGLQFTEERFEEEDVDFREIHGAISQQARTGGVVAIMGHMHEPWKCHRLYLCQQLYIQGATVNHMVWSSKFKADTLSHIHVWSKSREKTSYFREAEAIIEEKKTKLTSSGRNGIQAIHVQWEDYDPEMLNDGNNYVFHIPFETEIMWFPKLFTPGECDQVIRDVSENIDFHFPILKFDHSTGHSVELKNRRGIGRICDEYNTRVQGYRGNASELEAYPYQEWSRKLNNRMEAITGYPYNAIGLNYYADGTVAISPHADTAAGLGPNPVIASLSFGATRNFVLKSKRRLPNKSRLTKLYFPLHHGCCIVMGKNCQKYWLHQVPPDETIKTPRWNLTFRMYADKTLLKEDTAKRHTNGETSI